MRASATITATAALFLLAAGTAAAQTADHPSRSAVRATQAAPADAKDLYTIEAVPTAYARLGAEPAIQDLIRRYYAANATELGGTCRGVEISRFIAAPTILVDGPEAVLSVTYTFATLDPEAAGAACSGTNTRTVTLGQDAGTWRVRAMTSPAS